MLVQDSLDSAADSSNGSSGTQAHVTAQVVVNTTHNGQQILGEADTASTSTGTIVSSSPHYITVTGKKSLEKEIFLSLLIQCKCRS